MATIFSTDAFDAEAFEQEPHRSEESISNHIVSNLIDDYTEFMDEAIYTETGLNGWVDAILADLRAPLENTDEDQMRLEIIKLLSYLSEKSGRLTNEFGMYDPMFYGYLKSTELNKLRSLLVDLPADVNRGFLNNFKSNLIQIAEICEKKNLGLIFSALP